MREYDDALERQICSVHCFGTPRKERAWPQEHHNESFNLLEFHGSFCSSWRRLGYDLHMRLRRPPRPPRLPCCSLLLVHHSFEVRRSETSRYCVTITKKENKGE